MTAKLIPAELARAIAAEAANHHGNPVREGRVYAVLVAAGYDAHEIAELAGSNWNRVDLRLALLNLADNCMNALEQGLMPVGLAWYVARLSAPNQQLMLNRWLRGDFKNSIEASRVAGGILEDEQALVSL
ncbi:hypothetical protein [Streptomyces sp. enrichment culture]|uniref:hypothetical protein n=1 Tax=Streptomyces sp. enrichment culture TaxID=1795815 RepID=UPI003F552CE5